MRLPRATLQETRDPFPICGIGCNAQVQRPSSANLKGAINVLVSLDGEEGFAKGKLEEQALLTKEFAKDFEFVHPEVDIQIEITREADLLGSMWSPYRPD